MKRFLLVLGTACALLSLRARPAWSQDGAARQEATARLKAGLSFAKRGKWEQARLSFVQGYAVVPSVDLLWNLAFAELKSGHAMDALEHFEAYEIDPKAEASKVAALPKFRERAYQQVGRIKIQAPAGAFAWVDGGAQGWSQPINLAPGEHTVRLEFRDQSEERRFTVVAGQLLAMPFSFVEPAPAEPPSAVLAAAGPDAARLETPSPLVSSPANLTLGWIGVGAGTGALTVAVGFALAASAKANEVDAARSGGSPFACSANPAAAACNDLRDAVDKHDIYAEISTVSFVAASALGIATVGYFLFASHSPAVTVRPYAGLRESGLIVRAPF